MRNRKAAAIETSPEYWTVHQLTPLAMMCRWDKDYPAPIGCRDPARRQAYWAAQKVARTEHRKMFDEGRAKLKAIGADRDKRFQIEREADALAYAAGITSQTGVEMEVSRGFDLYF